MKKKSNNREKRLQILGLKSIERSEHFFKAEIHFQIEETCKVGRKDLISIIVTTLS